jgi:outer membrane protein assembly factor BamB
VETIALTELRDALQLGLTVVSDLWSYKAKNWVSSVHAADIDSDGDIEIIAGSRDGRVYVLSKGGDVRWRRIVGSKAWVGAVAGLSTADGRARIVVGTRDGKVYTFDKDGRTVGRDGSVYAFDKESGIALDQQKERAAYWHSSEHVIRQVVLSGTQPHDIVIGSEDRCVYALDYKSRMLRWTFATQGWVRAICCCDIDGDGQPEILAGSGDQHLYVLNWQGNCIGRRFIGFQIHTLYACDLDQDGRVEILLGTDDKDLTALTPDLQEKWHHLFPNRLLCLQVVDIDSDGRNEIIVSTEDKRLYVLDEHGHTLWRHYLGYRIFGIYALDFNNDGSVEILAGGDDDRVHALRIRLSRHLAGKIRHAYQALGRPVLEDLSDLLPEESALLRDIVGEDSQRHASLRQVTVEHAASLLQDGAHTQSLAILLRLKQQKVQALWRKEKIGHVRTLYFGDIAGDQRREIVLGTIAGTIQALNAAGRSLWSFRLPGQILSVQTGYVDHSRWQEILACVSDHHIYVISGTKKQVKRSQYIDDWISCLYVSAPTRQGPVEIIVGSEDRKIYLYGNNLSAPLRTIDTPQGIKIVYARHPGDDGGPEIIAGSLENAVYAYTRSGTLLWEYQTQDRVRAICVKDIDGDDAVEILVGSESRNLHVLDSQGHLKWRYFFPHRVLAVEAVDIDQDGKTEVLVGCGDGNLYVLSRDGDLLWTYQASDRIRAVHVEDIDDNRRMEIAVGAEDQLDLLGVVDQQQVRLLIDQCWLALCEQQSARGAIESLLQHHDPLLRAFALYRWAEQVGYNAQDFERLAEFVKDSSAEVRKALICSIMACYAINSPRAFQLLDQLSMDAAQDVRLAFVEHIHLLVKSDWALAFEYLNGFARNIDRFMRRAVVRKLHHLLDMPHEKYKENIFRLLIGAALDSESEWIRQEAGRTLAHFLDKHSGDLMPRLYECITAGIQPAILQHMANNAATTIVQQTLQALVGLLAGLDEDNMLERVELAVKALEETKSLLQGAETWLIYDNLRQLLMLRTIEDIAHYQSKFAADLPGASDQMLVMVRICNRLGAITRILRIFLRRDDLNDRLASLLEASAAIEAMHKFVEREYAVALPGAGMLHLPDRRIFELLLNRWQAIVRAQLNELRGKAELRVELQTKRTRHEKQIGLWLKIHNVGRSTASNVKVTLLHSDDFIAAGNNSFETEVIFSQEEAQAEFSIRPGTTGGALDLVFEVVYDDAEADLKMISVCERLELQPLPQQFRTIPNPYSTGTPTLDSGMFFGREEDIEFLRDNLARTTAKSIIILYGQRRSGKTTLLHHLVNAGALDPHFPILIDMQQQAYGITINKFLYNIAFAIQKSMAKRGMKSLSPDRGNFEIDPTFFFSGFLEDIEADLQGRKLVLLIDEFEVLESLVAEKRLAPEIFGYLRSLMQHRPSLDVLLSGTHKIEQLTRNYWSVFFNIARHYKLSRLSEQSARALIEQPVAGYLEYEPYAVDKIRQLTGDQPYLIHLICRSLVEHCNDQRKSYATINDVNVVLREVMQTGHYHFTWIWEQIEPEERIALAAIAAGGRDEGRAISLVEMEEIYREERLPCKREQLLACLKALEEADVIERIAGSMQGKATDGARYRIPVGLIRAWLLNEKPLEQLMHTHQIG